MTFRVVIELIIFLFLIQYLDGTCPANCTCSRDLIDSCSIRHLNETNRLYDAKMTELRVQRCNKYFKANQMITVSKLRSSCTDIRDILGLFVDWFPNLLVINNKISETECAYKFYINTSRSECEKKCFKGISISNHCICTNCINITTNLPKYGNQYGNQSTMDKNATIQLYAPTNISGSNQTEPLEYRFYFLILSATLSSLAVLLNILFMIRICFWKKITLLNTFGFFIMLFNIILAAYGVVMTVYIFLNWPAEMRFCQGFTSIKLFALGSNVWTLMMFSFITSVLSDEKEDVKDSVFKGIVYILEGIMLAGVCSVMSWIKLDKWNFMCSILEPVTTVDSILVGIEISYYTILVLLILRYPYYLFRRDSEITKKLYLKKYLRSEHPIFVMLFLSCLFWVVGYSITLPKLRLFSLKMAAVIRVDMLMIPLIIQPIIFSLRNVYCCSQQNRNYKKEDDDGQHEKSDEDQFVKEKLEDTANDQNDTDMKRSRKFPTTKETQEIKKNNWKNNQILTPKLVCRSPITSEIRMDQKRLSGGESITGEKECAEYLPLLPTISIEENKISPKKMEKPKTLDLKVEKQPLLDGVDGIKKAPVVLQESTPVLCLESPRRWATEFPSFISIEGAIDRTEKANTNSRDLPIKSRAEILKSESISDDSRASRGPTFYDISDINNDTPSSGVKDNKSNSESVIKENDDIPFDDINGKIISPTLQIRAESKESDLIKNDDEVSIPLIDQKKLSETSLEWDDSYISSNSLNDHCDNNHTKSVPENNKHQTNIYPECGWEPYIAEEQSKSVENLNGEQCITIDKPATSLETANVELSKIVKNHVDEKKTKISKPKFKICRGKSKSDSKSKQKEEIQT